MKARASPASCASYCYFACVADSVRVCIKLLVRVTICPSFFVDCFGDLMADIEFLRRIKSLVVLSIFSKPELKNLLVLKGGNLLDLVFQLSGRSSVDVDMSMDEVIDNCLLYTSPSPRDRQKSRMPSSA